MRMPAALRSALWLLRIVEGPLLFASTREKLGSHRQLPVSSCSASAIPHRASARLVVALLALLR